MKIPLLDLKAQYAQIRGEIEPAVIDVLNSQYFIMGPVVKSFEGEVANYCGSKHAVGCASGTDAILLALMALGVKEGDEVITTPYTFFATSGSIVRLGAKPVYCDIKPDTFNIDPDGIERLITPKTKAILLVHLYGLMADMGKLGEIARKHGIPLIEDAAQSIGASSPDGKSCSTGLMGCISFFPSKNLGGAGDGGMVTTDDEELFSKLDILRVHGSKPKYYHSVVGINSRLDALQAAILKIKLKYLDSWAAKRQQNAALYTKLIEDKGISGKVVAPVTPEGYNHVFNQFVVMVENRDALREHLSKNDVNTEIYYPVPLHLQQCFAYLGYKKGDFPVSEKAADSTLALPIYAELTEEMQEYVIDTIAGFYK